VLWALQAMLALNSMTRHLFIVAAADVPSADVA